MNNLTHELKRGEIFVDGKLIRASHAATKFQGMSDLKNSFSLGEDIYIYEVDKGYYVKYLKDDFQQIILQIFTELDLRPQITKNYVTELCWFIITDTRKAKQINYDYITFCNGNLDLNTMKLVPWSPDIVSISKINYSYDSDAEAKLFKEFINVSFEKDSHNFIRAFFWSAIRGDNRAQVFLYVLGPGGTGKSTFVNILGMIMGKEGTLTTTLRDLSQDKFEGFNLVGKRLICINDTETFHGDLSVIKAITGGDSIQGRVKHQSGSTEIIPRGLLVVTGNAPLQTRDASGAISRRMRVLNMNNPVTPERRKPLLYFRDGQWNGPLASECSGILNWSRINENEGYKLLTDVSLTPSIQGAHSEAQALMNPLKEWIVSDLIIEPSLKSHIGFVPKKIDPQNLVSLIKLKKTLYPSYLYFCHLRSIKPLNHVKFSMDLISTCLSLGINIEKGKSKYGVYITGLGVNLETIYNETNTSIDIGITPPQVNENIITNIQSGDMSSKFLWPSDKREALFWQTRDLELYSKYYSALGSSDLKVQINKLGRTFSPDPDKLVTEHVSLLKGLHNVKVDGLDYDFGKPSPEFNDNLRVHVIKGINKVRTSIVPYKYKPMGLSPRILPQNYGDSFNSVKKLVRIEAYKHISSSLNGYVVLDVDLKSCYTTLLLGLFPVEMYNVREAIEGPGLWNYIEDLFKRSGRQSLFNKPAVKICVYSSFFGGGPRAMIDGTLEYMRKDIGLTPAQFRNASYIEALKALSRDVSEFVNSTNIIEDFRSVARYISKNYDGQIIKGPTQHEYLINESQHRTSYPNFLQSFEFYLLAKSTLNALSLIPEAQLIGHFHDGNVIIVPSNLAEQYVTTVNVELESLRQDLCLDYPQTVEYQLIN